MRIFAEFLNRIPWTFLVPIAVVLGLAPFSPEPHLFEKLRMLVNGQLRKPLDIFDLCMHGAPLMLIFFKLMLSRTAPAKGK
jgi:hypothetical protein